MKPALLISKCLTGAACRYDGRDNRVDLGDLGRHYTLIPVCPEQLGGLPTPRTPAERRGDRVVARDGRDVTDAFRLGARRTAALAAQCGARCALLKARSPSCGTREIHDGTFSGAVVPGMGLAAECLRDMGLALYDESQIEELDIKEH